MNDSPPVEYILPPGIILRGEILNNKIVKRFLQEAWVSYWIHDLPINIKVLKLHPILGMTLQIYTMKSNA